MRFTKAEFAEMVDELLFKDPICFDMLCRIAEKTLRPSVVSWCAGEECLRGRGYEDDIMQQIHLRLIQTTVDYFLLRDDVEGAYNNDPEGFEDWIFRVADNLKRDFVRKIRKRDFMTEAMDAPAVGGMAAGDLDEDGEEDMQRLKEAFDIVISSEVGIYKILTWLAQFVFILGEDITKIESNEQIVTAFPEQTLYDMYAGILAAAGKIPWIAVSREQNERILSALRKDRGDGVTYGETKYKDFFMKYKGEPSGKKSVSDWVNRMNDRIQRKMEPASASENKATEQAFPKTGRKKRRGADDTSDG